MIDEIYSLRTFQVSRSQSRQRGPSCSHLHLLHREVGPGSRAPSSGFRSVEASVSPHPPAPRLWVPITRAQVHSRPLPGGPLLAFQERMNTWLRSDRRTAASGRCCAVRSPWVTTTVTKPRGDLEADVHGHGFVRSQGKYQAATVPSNAASRRLPRRSPAGALGPPERASPSLPSRSAAETRPATGRQARPAHETARGKTPLCANRTCPFRKRRKETVSNKATKSLGLVRHRDPLHLFLRVFF